MVELKGHHSAQMYSQADSGRFEYCGPAEMF